MRRSARGRTIGQRSCEPFIEWFAPVGLAGLWTALALANPTTTYHLAPVLVTALWTIGRRAARSGPWEAGRALTVAGTALGIVASVLVVLVAFDALRGPSLVPGTGPLGESILAALAGAGYGVVVLVRSSPPWYLR